MSFIDKYVCVVGAGFSGAVIARELADAGVKVLVVDERDHVAGNCHTERDPISGVLVHKYGPHIFHTKDAEVWQYINRFGQMMPYIHRVKSMVHGRVYSMPLNLHTLNQFFGLAMRPAEARAFIRDLACGDVSNPENFEEQALAFMGPEIYDAFFKHYTRKQWGVEPHMLPAAILKRLPMRFCYDDNYFNHPFQGMPKDGYSSIVKAILDHPKIELRTSTSYESLCAYGEKYAHIFYSGPLDRYFGHRYGRLGYRTLDFKAERFEGDYQGCAVMNYPDADAPFTRITEHKHFAPWEAEKHSQTIIFREYSRQAGPEDIPYYPIRLTSEMAMLRRYEQLAKAETGVSFVGRLGTYRYLDMDVTIREALDAARAWLATHSTNRACVLSR